MEVKHTKSFSDHPGYSIEWGYATWTENEKEEDKDWSIRNRKSTSGGGFNVRGSSEIPWEDFKKLIHESIIENQFSNQELKSICKMAFKRLIKNLLKK